MIDLDAELDKSATPGAVDQEQNNQEEHGNLDDGSQDLNEDLDPEDENLDGDGDEDFDGEDLDLDADGDEDAKAVKQAAEAKKAEEARKAEEAAKTKPEPTPAVDETELSTAFDEHFAKNQPDVKPGTKEYRDRIKKLAKDRVIAEHGSYDPLDENHSGDYALYVSEIDAAGRKAYDEAKKGYVSEQKQEHSKASAAQRLKSILKTPEARAAYQKALDAKPHGEIKALEKKAKENGDYSGFFALAQQVVKAGVKADKIKEKQRQRDKRQPPPHIGKSGARRASGGGGDAASFMGIK